MHVFDKQETAEILRVSTRTLDRMIARGEAPHRVLISEGRVGFTEEAIRDFLAERTETRAA